MMGSNIADEIDCGSFFDHIDDLIDFPPENDAGIGSGDCKTLPSIWSGPSEGLPAPDPILSGNHSDSTSDLSTELSVPYEDIMQLEWLSTFVEDSFAGGGMTLAKNFSVNKEESVHNHFQTSSPVSVLESSSSSSSCSGGRNMPLSQTQRGPQRARSKRPRPASFNPRAAIKLISPTSSVAETFPLIACSESEIVAESSHPMENIPKLAASLEHKKKKKIKLPAPPMGPTTEMNQNHSPQARKCMHCEISKTPQWRAGPMGPKTLCNACGVRYKSGRLFPEYRPAASPTFVPSLHSNSHKKVLEMRTKAGGELVAIPGQPDDEALPKGKLPQSSM